MKKQFSGLLLIAFFSISTMHPISNNVAIALSGATSVGASAGAWAILKNNQAENNVAALGATATLIGAAALSHWFFNQFTPHGRYERATKKILEAKNFGLLQEEFLDHKSIAKYARQIYLTNDWYLVKAKVALDRSIKDLVEAVGLLAAAESELRGDITFCSNCKAMTLLAHQIINQASDLVDLLVSDTDEYNRQYKRYQKHLEIEQRERQHREEMERESVRHWSKYEQKERHHREKLKKKEQKQNDILLLL